jgi:predicted RNA-binding Zn-ribbon protein involved in translation (DUF1610 family)
MGVRFRKRSAQLKTVLTAFLEFEWLRERADIYVCDSCGRLEWFLGSSGPKPSFPHDVECLACGIVIPAGQPQCSACGWTYEEGKKPTNETNQ